MGMGVSELAFFGASALACAALLALLAALLWVRSTKRKHRALLDQLPQTALAVFDHDMRVRLAAGGALLGITNKPRDEIEGCFVLGQVPKVQRESLLIHFRAALRGEQRSFEYRSPLSGRDHWVRVLPLTDAKGAVEGGLVVALDISDRKRGEPEALRRRADVEAVTEATRELARSVDQSAARKAVCEGARSVADAPVAALFELGPDQTTLDVTAVVGATLTGYELPLDGDGGAVLAFTRAEEMFISLGDGEAAADREFMRRARVRAVLWHPVLRERLPIGVLAIGWHEKVAGISLRLSSMIDLLGAEAAVAIGRADLLGELERQARTDELTGLPNRRDWEAALPSELARSARVEEPLCIAMLDLDHFKAYNDRRGHQAGDRLLTSAASAWQTALRPYDILARYGGEEFSAILPGCDIEDAVSLVDRLRAGTPEGESCSAGIAKWDGDEHADALVGRADAALYKAKRAGRDRTIVANM